MRRNFLIKFNQIQVETPYNAILSRLGYNKHLTDMNEKTSMKINDSINYAKNLCEPAGCFYITKIEKNHGGTVRIQNGIEFNSTNVSKLLNGSSEIIFFAGTVGENIIHEIENEIKNEKASTALIYDAVASETTDAVMDWMISYFSSELLREGLKPTKTRYSADYDDLGLENQKKFYEILRLNELGIKLTQEFILVPEKSVTALCGVEQIIN